MLSVSCKPNVLAAAACNATSMLGSSSNMVKNNYIGKNSNKGISLEDSNGNIIKNNNIKSSGRAILLQSSNNILINGNSIGKSSRGISLEISSNNTISGNNITNNWNGIQLRRSSTNNSITDNKIANSGHASVDVRISGDNVISGNKIISNGGGINLISSNNSVIKGNEIKNNGEGISLRSSCGNVISDNKIISNSGRGILLMCSSNNNTISDNKIISNGDMGIRLASSSNNIINDNKIENNGNSGVCITSSSNNNTVSGNSIKYNARGIALGTSSENVIDENSIMSNGHLNIRLASASNNLIKNNKIKNGQNGISVSGSSNNNTISNNSLSNNWNGIRLSGSSNNNTISNNSLSNNWNGIRLSGSSNNNTIARNSITNNRIGIYLKASSGNIVYRNNFIENERNAQDESGGNSFNSSRIGNYWDDYKGSDRDGNGIGDTPYEIPGKGKGYYPLMIPITPGLTVGISYPEHGVNHSNVTVSWFYYNDTPVVSAALYLNDTLMVNESVTNYTLKNLQAGSYYIVNITAYDLAGNKAQDSTTFTVDFTAPSINITSPSSGESIKAFNITVDWEGNDSGSGMDYYQVRIDPSGWKDVEDSTSYEFTGLSEGNHTVDVRASDYAGNTVNASVTFHVVYPKWNLFVGCTSSYINYQVRVEGNLTWGAKEMEGKRIVMWSNRTGLIANIRTEEDGVFSLVWEPTVSGTYRITFSWQFAEHVVTLSVTPQQKERVFSVISNSTVKRLAFNSTSKELGFQVEGPSGTRGYVNVTIDKDIVTNATDITVYLGGEEMRYDVIDLGGSWMLHFTYEHSTHSVNIVLGATAEEEKSGVAGLPIALLAGIGVAVAVAVAAVGVVYFLKVRKT